MKFFINLLIFISFLSLHNISRAEAGDRKIGPFSWPPSIASLKINAPSKQYNINKKYDPYLENERHLQIPQWANTDWYVEDWTVQKEAAQLIKQWYGADILKEQTVGHADLPVLVVGPNFYHLSGLDKRRVVHTVDTAYGITERSEHASFMLTDWYTKRPIGVFDRHGLRLH